MKLFINDVTQHITPLPLCTNMCLVGSSGVGIYSIGWPFSKEGQMLSQVQVNIFVYLHDRNHYGKMEGIYCALCWDSQQHMQVNSLILLL